MRTLTLEKKKDASLNLRFDHIGNLTLTDVCLDHIQENVSRHAMSGFSKKEWLMDVDSFIHLHLRSDCKPRNLSLALPYPDMDQRGGDYVEENAARRSMRIWNNDLANTPLFYGVRAFWQLDPDQLDQIELNMAILEL